MVLRPGDVVPDNSCEPVGNFPHGLLTDPNALALDSGAFGPIPAFANKKQDYIDAFDANGLIVCNESQFAKPKSPYIVHLTTEEDEPPDVPQEGRDRYIQIHDGNGSYNVSTYGPLGYTSDNWFRQFLQSSIGCPCGSGCPNDLSIFREDWSVGSVTFDLENGPGLTAKNYRTGLLGSYYMNQFFFCAAVIEYSVYGINLSFERRQEIILTATVTLTFSNDHSTLVWTDTKISNPGFPALYFSSGVQGDSTNWPYGFSTGFLSKSAAFSIRVEVALKGPSYIDNDPTTQVQGPIPWCP